MKVSVLFISLFISTFSIAQKSFKINLTAKEHINSTINFGIQRSRTGFESIYQFSADGDNVEEQYFPGSVRNTFYSIKIEDENNITGFIDHPVKVFIVYRNMEDGSSGVVKPFWLDEGEYNIDLPKLNGPVVVPVDNAANREEVVFQKYLDPAYKRGEGIFARDELISLETKTKLLNEYIKANPDSFIALWEVFEDFSNYKNVKNYSNAMDLFSDEMKATSMYKTINDKISKIVQSVGSPFPNVKFDESNSLSTSDFQKYKLTFIEFWATSCGPCIKAMPEMVKLQKEFSEKGVNFIVVTDETEPKRIAMAKEILEKNKVTWTNYFDMNKEFGTKLFMTGYPLQLVVDENGVIIARFSNNLEGVRETFLANL